MWARVRARALEHRLVHVKAYFRTPNQALALICGCSRIIESKMAVRYA